MVRSVRLKNGTCRIQRQLNSKGLIAKEGSIQDATFITKNPAAPGNRATGDNARNRRSKDGTWSKKE